MTQAPFWQPAMARPQLWRTALGFVTVMALWLAGTFGILTLAASLTLRSLGQLAAGSDYTSAAAFFLTFLSFHLALALMLPVLHRRSYLTLFGPERRMNLRHFAIGSVVTLGIAALLAATMALEPLFLPADILPAVSRARPFVPWLAGLGPALVLIFIQTLGEEVVFRGYLLQQLRARLASPLIWAVLPALVFGLLHFDAASYGTLNASLYVLNATVSGSIAALVTARTGTLGAAAGLHFGNNAALTLLGLKGNFEGFSLWVVGMDLSGPYATWSIAAQTVTMILAWAIWRRATRLQNRRAATR